MNVGNVSGTPASSPTTKAHPTEPISVRGAGAAAASCNGPAHPTTTTDSEKLFNSLRQLMVDCGPKANKHDLAIVLISACIDEGINVRARIIGVLHSLGLNPGHVAIILNEGTGTDPDRYRWWRDRDGRYHSHPNA